MIRQYIVPSALRLGGEPLPQAQHRGLHRLHRRNPR